MSNELTIVEATSLREHEGTISRYAHAFVSAGSALAAINGRKLFRGTYETFEAYCVGKWGFSDVHARRLIRGAEVVAQIKPIGSVLPASESQARPLTTIPMKEVAGVWREVVSVAPLDEAGNPKITAALVQHTVDLHRGDPKPPDQTSTDVDIKPVVPERLCADCDGPEGQCGCTAVVEVDDPDPVEIPEDATGIPAPGDLTDVDMNIVAEMLRACCDALDELEHKPTAAHWIRFGEQFARYVTTQATGAANDPTEEL